MCAAAQGSPDTNSFYPASFQTLLVAQVWQPDESTPALKLVWSPVGIITALFYLAATVYYFYVRVRFTMALGSTSWCVAGVCGLSGRVCA